MYRRHGGWFKHLDFMILDLTVLLVSVLASYLIRFGFTPYLDPYYRNSIFVLLLADFFVMICLDTYHNVLRRGYWREFVKLFFQVCALIGIFVVFLFTTHNIAEYSRMVFYLTIMFYSITSYLVRVLWKSILQNSHKSQKPSLLALTNNAQAEHTGRLMQSGIYKNYKIDGLVVLDCDRTGETIDGVQVKAASDTVLDYICREWVDEVFLDFVGYPKEIANLIEKISEMGVVVHLKIPDESSVQHVKIMAEKIGDDTVLTWGVNFVSPFKMLIKRAVDILAGLLGCCITGILFIILGPIIYAKSPGPIFFKQIRVGKNGKKFKMYKFRSMYMDAEERKKELLKENRVQDGMMFKLDWDPRIIGSSVLPDGTTKKGIGNIIRDYSLDEFPQFINVLKGDMSLVGTRPPTVDEWEKYEYHHRARLAAKPGITGMWQVSGRSNITDFEDVVKLDMQYIREWSLGLDVKIVLKTVAAVFKKDGAM